MILSLTIIRYPPYFVPMALLAMALHRLPLSLNRKCRFWKLMGSGNKGSFDLKPDWQQWALLAVWDSEDAFYSFQRRSFIRRWWKLFATEQWTVLCSPLSSKGRWDGKEPFGNQFDGDGSEGLVAVLTRATIRPTRLRNFWSNVDRVASIMIKAEGYITSFGVGEAPFMRQATFSLWRSADDMKAFAYHSAEHRDVIRLTREEDWYSEELFARFKPFATFGSLRGQDPLKSFL